MDQPLAQLEANMAAVDLSMCDSAALRTLSTRANAGIRIIEGYLAQIARAARCLEEAGHGSTAEDTLRSGGAVSGKAAKKRAARADVGELLPEVGAGLEVGSVRPENVDILAAKAKHLSEAERERLARDDAELAKKSALLSPELSGASSTTSGASSSTTGSSNTALRSTPTPPTPPSTIGPPRCTTSLGEARPAQARLPRMGSRRRCGRGWR